MRVDKCERCSESFEVIEIGGGQPHKPESDDITCPYCGHQKWEKTTGTFITKKLCRG
jgi:DNA-directed RNA polymerase subunit RPC12/RpoP